MVGWLLFFISFFLPTVRGIASGWEAFYFAFIAGKLFHFTSALSNIPMLLTPLALQLKSKKLNVAMSIIMIAATLLNSLWYIKFPEERRDLQAGYFLWVTSFAIVAIAITLRARDLHKSSAPISN